MLYKKVLFTFDQLIFFQTVALAGSLQVASKNLSIKQSAISRQIKKLENGLNTQLFYRSGTHVNLTCSGHLFLRYVNRILKLCFETTESMKKMEVSETNQLIVGSSQVTGTYFLPQVGSLFRRRYPDVSIRLHVDTTEQIIWNIVKNTIDVGIIGGDINLSLFKQIQSTFYVKDELVIILPTNHFLRFSSVKKEHLFGLNYIVLESSKDLRRTIDESLVKNGIDVNKFGVVIELKTLKAIKNAVQSGLGISFIPFSCIVNEINQNLLCHIRVENKQIFRAVWIVFNSNSCRFNNVNDFHAQVLGILLQ